MCPICLDALPDYGYSVDYPDGIIMLGCTHQFHGSCLRGSVESAGRNATNMGTVNETGHTMWRVMPPRCPMCRARFVAATYWGDLADIDNFPDAGYEFIDPAQAIDTDSSESESEEDSEDNMENDSNSEDEGSSDSEPDSPYVTGPVLCNECNQTNGHTEMTAEEYLAQTDRDNPQCTICNQGINAMDAAPVLRCPNCGAASHYHD